MELKEVLFRRRSVRKFTDEPVTDAEIDILLRAAMSGPSAVDRRPWHFYVVTEKGRLEALRGVTRFTRMASPLDIVVCGDTGRALPMQLAEFWVQDCSAAAENILLQAVDLGLGAVWCGLYPQKNASKKAAEILGAPARHVPLGLIHIGHPAEKPEGRDRFEEARVTYLR